MKKNLSDYLVALAVIGCSVVLLVALTVALSGYRLKKPSRTLQIDYADVTGIHLASDLRYAGAPAGHVIGIRLLTADERNAEAAKDPAAAANAVRVTVEVDDNVPPLRVDMRASLNSDTLLAEKFVALSAGSTGSEVLPGDAVIQGHPGSLDQLLNGGGDLIPKIDDLLASLQGDVKEVIPKLDGVLDSAHKALDTGESLLSDADNLVGDKGSLRLTINQVHEAVTKLEGIEGDLDGALKNANGFITDTNQNLDGRMKELAVVLQNLKVATTYLKAFSQQIAEKPNRIIFMGKATQLQDENKILQSKKPIPAKAGEPSPSPAQ